MMEQDLSSESPKSSDWGGGVDMDADEGTHWIWLSCQYIFKLIVVD